MSEDIVAKALKLLRAESQKNLGLQKFYDNFSDGIKKAYNEYERCIEENGKKKKEGTQVYSNITCRIDDENALSLGKLQEEFKSARTDDNNICDYLLYWMSDKIKECEFNTHCTIWLYNVFWKFWENSSCCEKDECKKMFVVEFDMKALKNKKELYEFLEHYNNIEKTLKEGNFEINVTYCKYAKYMFDLYRLMDNENVHKIYEKELQHFQNTFNDNYKLSKLKEVCNDQSLSVKLKIEENERNLLLHDQFDRFIPHSSDFSSYVIQTPTVMNDVLGDTPSYKLYAEFDKEGTDSDSNKYCDNYFKEEKTYKDDCIKICKKILNNFKKLYTVDSTLKSSERCLHYKNWVYHEIWKMFITKSDYKHYKDIIDKFLKIQNEKNKFNNDEKYVCHYYFIFKDFTELNAKKEEKDLGDYFNYHKTIEQNVSNKKNEIKYKTYLTYINKLYERHIEDWNCCDTSSGVHPLCRHYFKCEEEYHPSYLMSILLGKKDESYLQKKKNFPVVIIGEEDPPKGAKEDDVMRIQYGRCTYVSDPYNKEKKFGMRCDYKASPKHFENIYKNLPDGKKKIASQSISETESSTVNMSNLSGISNMEENESNPVSYKIPTSVALGLGTVFVFFLYYKFTPFGSLFGKRDLGGRSFEDDFNEEQDIAINIKLNYIKIKKYRLIILV
ncbi:PIR Superfamily Protein [Plasmodium ovale wallikeri]|uniref:PIR Superfamily Protein n=1 Tax=Plasmodium ovale wallikeri TaxID=864142 RepID=A0A1A9AGY4_PLAOA|nr:PIR Superfamily Protein [Plasmodium ovale wallikeri]